MFRHVDTVGATVAVPVKCHAFMNALSVLLVFALFFVSYCFLMFADGELNFTSHELS